MSNTTDKMLDRYVYLHIGADDIFSPESEEQSGITIHVKLDDEGVSVDAYAREDEFINGTWKTYNEMGVEVKMSKKDGGHLDGFGLPSEEIEDE
jgi:hypothetical protein